MRRRAHRLIGGRSVDRLINFSDAVVAVAVTVLVLPLVDIAGPSGGGTVWDVLSDHASEIGAFLLTFYVVVLMWIVHNRILNEIIRYDPTLMWLNATWLVGIVLIPWFSSMYGQSQGDSPSVGVLYWIVLAAISLLSTAMGRHIARHPELLPADTPEVSPAERRRRAVRGPAFGAYFLVIAATWQLAPVIAPWMAFGIIPLNFWLRPVREEAATEDEMESA